MTAPASASGLVLYDAANVPSPRRVRICLFEKRLPFTIRWLNLGLMDQKAPDYLTVNPMGLVPTLIHGDTTIYDSNVINEYLDALQPAPPLMPCDPRGQAQVRMWFAFENDWAKPFRAVVYETLAKDRIRATGLTAQQVKGEIAKRTPNPVYGAIAERLLVAPPDDRLVVEQLALVFEKIEQMERVLGDGRPWLCGEAFTLADIALAPRLDMFPALGVDDLPRRFPATGAFLERVKARPSWTQSALVPQPGEVERSVTP